MSPARITMVSEEDIESEFGWNNKMIYSLLHAPDSPHGRRNSHTGGYTYGLYKRERVLAIAQSKEGRDAKRRWNETLRGNRPNPGWTTRLGDMGRMLGITAVAVGKLLERLGYRTDKHVSYSAVTAGCGVRRWDGYVFYDDWHPDRVVAAIRLAAQDAGNPAIAEALAAAIAKQEGRERMAARKRKQEEEEAVRRQEEEAVVSALAVQLRALQACDPRMDLLTAVEFITSDPAHRVALYSRCIPGDRSVNGTGQDAHRPLAIASSVSRDLALLTRRAMAEGFGFR
jgi:hypothetical protein